MCMDFFKKLFELIIYNRENGEELEEQVFLLDDDDLEAESVVTFHPDGNGNLVFNVFSIEVWEMIDDISELTGRDKFSIIEGLCEEDGIESWVIDPREFPNDLNDL